MSEYKVLCLTGNDNGKRARSYKRFAVVHVDIQVVTRNGVGREICRSLNFSGCNCKNTPNLILKLQWFIRKYHIIQCDENEW